MKSKKPAVVIIGPPWSRSGPARIMRHQVEYYRDRGYRTLFLCVPVNECITQYHPDWEGHKDTMRELGADRTFFAAVDRSRFASKALAADAGRAFHGTTLDLMAFTATSSRLPDDARRAVRQARIALIHANYACTLGFARLLRQGVIRDVRQAPIIVETHDVAAHHLEMKREPNPLTRRLDDPEELLRAELALLKTAKVLVHCSADDMDFLRRRLARKPHVLALPPIDEAFVSSVAAARPLRAPVDLLFVGAKTPHNCEALRWFFERAWPRIEGRGYRVKIVGGIDAMARKRLPAIYRAFSACFSGTVSDLAPYYRAARCVINPAVSGTGIAIKTIEALALGKPFVGTSKAYRGLPMKSLERAGLRAHDTPKRFAGAVVRTLSDERSAAAASRTAYDGIFSKQAAFSSRDEAVRLALEGRR